MLLEKINEDLKSAMKAREEAKVQTLRYVLAALKNKKIEVVRELNEEEVLVVIRTLVKQYKDAVEDFKRGGREDLVSKTEEEITLLETYLPGALPEEDIKNIVQQKIAEFGQVQVGAGNFGKIMGAVMKDIGGRASGDAVLKIVKEMLEEFKMKN